MDNFIAVGNNEPTPDNLPDEIKKIINDGKKKAGFNPDGTPMSNPTDTNQASEDKLDEILEDVYYSGYSDGKDSESGYGGAVDADSRHIAKSDIQSLIRTEKLKLLAEVRERVVGEDVEPHHELCTMESCVCSNGTRNDLRKKQKTELTKLEAEL